MGTILTPRKLGIFLSLLLSCSCAMMPRPATIIPAPDLPADVTMNPDAGGGNWLFVTLHLEDGKELPFLIDTGCASTWLDQSLVAKLGKPIASDRHASPSYPAPKLFLGKVQLKTGNTVEVEDFTKESSFKGRRVMGVLGIDCLKHYCIQLDFETGKIHFLDPNHLETASLGQAFPLHFSETWHQPLLEDCNLVEGKGKPTLIDSGYLADGTLNSEQFATAIRDGAVIPIENKPGWVLLRKCLWKRESYTGLIIASADWNAIGLKFLARHLVTLNFPERKIYLKQTRIGPFIGKDLETGIEFLKDLEKKGRLPGWTKEDNRNGHVNFDYHVFDFDDSRLPWSATIDCQKNGDSSVYHYTAAQASQGGSWQLQKAWRTDQNDKTVQEYPIR